MWARFFANFIPHNISYYKTYFMTVPQDGITLGTEVFGPLAVRNCNKFVIINVAQNHRKHTGNRLRSCFCDCVCMNCRGTEEPWEITYSSL